MKTFAYKAVLKYGIATVTNYFSDLETTVDQIVEYIAVTNGGKMAKKSKDITRSEVLEYLQGVKNRDKDAAWTVRLDEGEEDGIYIDVSRIVIRTGRNEVFNSADIEDAIAAEK